VHRPFRGLLSVHSRYGPHTRAATNAWHAYPKASDISSPPCLLRLLPAGAVAGWGLHPLESAAFSRRTPFSDIRCRELVAPKQPVAHAPRPPKGSPQQWTYRGRRHTGRLRRRARLETVRGHYLGSLACKTSAGRHFGRVTAPGRPGASQTLADHAIPPDAAALPVVGGAALFGLNLFGLDHAML